MGKSVRRDASARLRRARPRRRTRWGGSWLPDTLAGRSATIGSGRRRREAGARYLADFTVQAAMPTAWAMPMVTAVAATAIDSTSASDVTSWATILLRRPRMRVWLRGAKP